MKAIKITAGRLYSQTAHLFGLPVLFVFITAYNGQSQTDLPRDTKRTTSGQSKIIKNPGTNQYVNVHCGIQDKAGNLWFGTTGDGVYRYDGHLFTNFTTKDGLNHNTVWSISEDKTGRIWFGTDAGICRYDGKAFASVPITATNNRYFNPINTTSNNLPAKNAVWSIFQAKSGTLWFGTDEGLYCYDGRFMTRFLDNKGIINKNALQLKSVQCIFEDKAGNMWFGSGPMSFEGLCRYDGSSLVNFKPNGEGWIRKILEDKNGNLCLATRHQGICRYDGKTFTNITEKEGLCNSCFTTVLEDKKGNLWFGTENGSGEEGEDGGLWRYASQPSDGKPYTRFTTNEGLHHNGVFFIMEDRAGNIWAGTRNTGVCRYNGKTFTDFSVNAHKK
ncbi:MAG: two-component regulator propeller domain-containing protein [Spirosomataceae bacterium]